MTFILGLFLVLNFTVARAQKINHTCIGAVNQELKKMNQDKNVKVVIAADTSVVQFQKAPKRVLVELEKINNENSKEEVIKSLVDMHKYLKSYKANSNRRNGDREKWEMEMISETSAKINSALGSVREMKKILESPGEGFLSRSYMSAHASLEGMIAAFKIPLVKNKRLAKEFYHYRQASTGANNGSILKYYPNGMPNEEEGPTYEYTDSQSRIIKVFLANSQTCKPVRISILEARKGNDKEGKRTELGQGACNKLFNSNKNKDLVQLCTDYSFRNSGEEDSIKNPASGTGKSRP